MQTVNVSEALFLEVARKQIAAFPVNGQSSDQVRAALVRRFKADLGRSVIVSGAQVSALMAKHFRPGSIRGYFVL